MKINKRRIFTVLKIIIIIYCVIGIAIYYLQDKFLFHPEKLDSNHAFNFSQTFEEMKIPVNKEDTINLIKFFPSDTIRKGIVIYYHGNRRHVEQYASYVDVFLKKGYEVWMADYPGYGKTTGRRTEKKMFQQARMVYDMAATKYKSDSLIIYGKSLGTGIAAYVSSYSPSKALVLETPYYSIPSLFRHYAFIYPVNYMSNYKIPTHEYVEEIKAPVIIFHGTGDKVIPYSNAAKLKPLLKAGDQFITIENGGHNTLTKSIEYRKLMDSLLQ